MKRFAAMLAVSVLMVLWIASGDRMSAGQRTDGLYYDCLLYTSRQRGV